MNEAPLTREIVAHFEGVSAQLQRAARYILDHPRDLALLTMREQARAAEGPPATMTRLAQHLRRESLHVHLGGARERTRLS